MNHRPAAPHPAGVIALVPLAALVALAGLALAPSRADAFGSDRGAKCAAIDDPAARLACYDAAYPRPARRGANAPSAVAPGVPVAPAVAVAPASTTPVVPAARPASEAEKFGLSERQRAEREPRPEQPPANAVTAAVVAVRKLPAGYLLIELDNGQQWQQIESAPNLYLRVGERVSIRKASLGSFLLETRSNFSTRVRRVQ